MEGFWLEGLLILFLIIANGFFACSEIAIISARKSRIKQLMEEGARRAEIVHQLQNKPDDLLATVQVGITMVGMLAGAISGAAAIETLKPILQQVPIGFIRQGSAPIAIGILVLIISYLTLILGELVPKSLALRFSEPISLVVGRPVQLLSRLTFILVRILTASSSFFLRPFGKMPQPEGSFVKQEVKLKDILRPVYFVPETKKIDALLRELQRRRMHMAIVINEYGGVEGIATMEDIIEEIVGEIEDEYDFEDRPVKTLKDGSMIIEASLPIRDLREQHQLAIEESEDYETLAGLVLSLLQRMPRGGEIVKYGDYKLTIVDIEGNRISKVKLEKVPPVPNRIGEKVQNRPQ